MPCQECVCPTSLAGAPREPARESSDRRTGCSHTANTKSHFVHPRGGKIFLEDFGRSSTAGASFGVRKSLGAGEPNIKCVILCCVLSWDGRAGDSPRWALVPHQEPCDPWGRGCPAAPCQLLCVLSSPFPQPTRVRLVTCWGRSTTMGRASSLAASCSASAWTGPSAASPSAPRTCGCRPPSAPTPGG